MLARQPSKYCVRHGGLAFRKQAALSAMSVSPYFEQKTRIIGVVLAGPERVFVDCMNVVRLVQMSSTTTNQERARADIWPRHRLTWGFADM